MPIELINISSSTQQDNNIDFDAIKKRLANPINKPYFVAVLADWCGHCQRMKPEWNKFLSLVKNKANKKTGKGIIITASDVTARLIDINVNGYPALLLYKNGEIEEYKGGRTVEDFKKYFNKHMNLTFGSSVKHRTSHKTRHRKQPSRRRSKHKSRSQKTRRKHWNSNKKKNKLHNRHEQRRKSNRHLTRRRYRRHRRRHRQNKLLHNNHRMENGIYNISLY